MAKAFEIIFVSTYGKDIGLQFLIYLYFLSHTFKRVGFKIRNSDPLRKIRLYIAGECTSDHKIVFKKDLALQKNYGVLTKVHRI